MATRLTKQEKFLRLCERGSGKKVEEAIQDGADINEEALIHGNNYPPIYVAAFNYNRSALKVLIKYGAEYVSFFYGAITHHQEPLIRVLLDCGADIDARDEQGHNALLYAIGENNHVAVKWLINHGANVDITFGEGYTALFYAAMVYIENDNKYKIDQRIIKYLIEYGADYRDSLLLAVKLRNYRLITIFLEYGADINVKTPYGQAPIINAIYDLENNPDLSMVRFLFSNGADPNTVICFDDGSKIGILSYAVSMNKTELAKIIIKKGANPNQKDSKGRSPLIYSVLVGKKILNILLKCGADPNTKDSEGRTPLMFAVIDADIEEGIIESLIEYDADINLQDKMGMTALMWAINGHDRSPDLVFSAFIRTGGLRASGWESWCSLALLYAAAEREIQLETVKFLVKSGADISIHDKKGMTALSYAYANSDDEIINILTKNI